MGFVMRERWLELVDRVADGAAGEEAERVFDDLVRRYGATERRYHNWSHVEACLRVFDTVRGLTQRPEAVELAIWFHDAIYDSHRGDNEDASAKLAMEALGRLGVKEEMGRYVGELILATRHRAVPSDADAALLVDIDLAILGESAEAFDAYEAAIRLEYAWVAEGAFRAGRGTVLRGLLERPWLYATEHFRRELEQRSRENLKRSLARLAG